MVRRAGPSPELASCLTASLLAVAAAACGDDAPPAAPAPALDAAVVLPDLVVPEPPPIPDFPEGTRSLRLTRTMPVRLTPDAQAKRIGTIAQDTRVRWKRTSPKGNGCKSVWVEMEPRGWVCGDSVEASTRAAIGVELPRLEREEVVPGTYGRITEQGALTYALPDPRAKKDAKKDPKTDPKKEKEKEKKKDAKAEPKPPPPPDAGVEPTAAPADGPVASPDAADADTVVRVKVDDPMIPGNPLLGSVTVRKYGELVFGDRVYWKVSQGNEYVAKKSVYEHKPSTFHGLRLADDTGLTLPVLFVWPRQNGVKQVWSRKKARGGGVVRQIEQRTAFSILETHEEGGKPVAYRIGEAEWLDAAQVRVAALTPPPEQVGPNERWFDVDLDQQLLVAYEGTTPVYATMVSTGKKETPTETGIWRLWKKISETDMKGLSGEDPYSVATVPWTQFYSPERGLALHASYWHDRFGIPRSHGCINLSPIDARWLYFWSEPVVPPGWTMTAGVLEAPGSVIRVRSKDDPAPTWKGYAKKVVAERAGEPDR